ncbi:hypothetical protein BRADI_3g02397v3 [Brachypodium distachyon]|uniref:Uncharacterized protein n=1 Tax=Brachypodium distachyon TaxID=15368 RepID=A0A0Q3F3P2_BRADI|nr:hypothetical protein BRADI_3g02397v3 [Brachypodium distachyon]
MVSVGKTSWPELVGMPAAQAAMTIFGERPDLGVLVLPVGTTLSSPGFDSARVCVFFDARDKLGRVAATPTVGCVVEESPSFTSDFST